MSFTAPSRAGGCMSRSTEAFSRGRINALLKDAAWY